MKKKVIISENMVVHIDPIKIRKAHQDLFKMLDKIAASDCKRERVK